MAIIPQTWPDPLLVLWTPYLKHGLLELYSSFCGHHTLHMVSSSYTLRFFAIIPQTKPPRVMLLVLWPPFLSASSSSFCGHHSSNMASSIYTPLLWPSYLKHGFLEFIAPLGLLILCSCGHSYLKHGLLELCSSFYDHHSSNMASSIYTPSFVAIIPQTWPPRVRFLVLWLSYLTHGLLELYSSFCDHHTLNMASSSYPPRFVVTIPQTWPPRVMLLALWP